MVDLVVSNHTTGVVYPQFCMKNAPMEEVKVIFDGIIAQLIEHPEAHNIEILIQDSNYYGIPNHALLL